MNWKEEMQTIATQQELSIELVLEASRALLSQSENFSIDNLEELVALRSSMIDEIVALDAKKKQISVDLDESVPMERSADFKVALQDLSRVDEKLQDVMRRRQVIIINSMASVRNRVNLNNLSESPSAPRRVLDVTR